MIRLELKGKKRLPDSVDLTGMCDEDNDVVYLGPAHRQPDGTYQALANLRGVLAMVKVNVCLLDDDG